MKSKVLIASSLIVGAFAAQSAMAQSATNEAPRVRSDVQREAVKANNTPMSQKIQPEVEANPDPSKLKPMASGTNQAVTRDETRQEAVRARDAGEIPRGDAVTTRALERKKASKMDADSKTRQEVSSEVPGARVRGEVKDQKDPKSSNNTSYR